MQWETKRKIFITAISQALQEIGAIKHQEVQLASGETSNLYIDLRLVFGNPKWFLKTQEAFANLILEKTPQFDGFATVPTAGLPFTAGLALKFEKPFFYIRGSKKEHGLHKIIEGGDVKGLKLVVIDDLISSGHSKLPAIDVLRDGGAIVEDVCVIIDRELGGKTTLKQQGINLHAVALISELKMS
ncbi:MAG: orotate phosphoribosyltransferase [Candidatus Heimdallarchaeota archaeon]